MEAAGNFWGANNLYPPMINSTIFTLTTKAVAQSVDYLNEKRSLCKEPSIELFCKAAEARTPFRDAFFAGMALTSYKVIEAIFWCAMAVIGLLTGNKEPIDLAKRAIIQVFSNITFTMVAGVGMCSPLWGAKVYAWALTEIAVQGVKYWETYKDTPEESAENQVLADAFGKIFEDKKAVPELARCAAGFSHAHRESVSAALVEIAKQHEAVTSSSEADPQSREVPLQAQQSTTVFERFSRMFISSNPQAAQSV